MLNVEELSRLLRQQRTTRQAFEWPFTLDETKWMVLAAYQTEVEARHRPFALDEGTKQNLRGVCEALCHPHPVPPPQAGEGVNQVRFQDVNTPRDTNIKTPSPATAGEGRGGGGILLCGQCGNGKTTTLYALKNLLLVLHDAGQLPQCDGMVVHDALDISRLAKDYNAFQRLKQQPMLGIEDMGREPRETLDFGNVHTPVIELLEYRYDKQLYTVITTNLTPKEITEQYGQRVGDRLREMMAVVVFENASYRGR